MKLLSHLEITVELCYVKTIFLATQYFDHTKDFYILYTRTLYKKINIPAMFLYQKA